MKLVYCKQVLILKNKISDLDCYLNVFIGTQNNDLTKNLEYILNYHNQI